jgi:hypothetical protein
MAIKFVIACLCMFAVISAFAQVRLESKDQSVCNGILCKGLKYNLFLSVMLNFPADSILREEVYVEQQVMHQNEISIEL